MRVFVALQLPEAALETAVAACARPRALDHDGALRWTRASNIHLTLHFLGETSPERAATVGRALDTVGQAALAPRLTITRLGGFPDRRRPRVVWLGLEEPAAQAGRLATLHRSVGAAITALGWQLDARPFQPHVTVARGRDRGAPRPLAAALVEALEAPLLAALAAMAWPRLTLVHSTLAAGGSRYETLREWTLAQD